MSSNILADLDGPCPKPFLREFDYPATGGFLDGRQCFPIPAFNATCCLPCPAAQWVYADGFEQRSQIANWMNLAAACATVFLLLSFVVLDVKWTHRHYLSVCLAVGVLFVELAFIVPLITQPEQCYNEITPNHMESDVTCAISGALLLLGGWSVLSWVFWRALTIHLQICWEVVTGPIFFYSALVLGWAIPAAGIATVLPFSGVSYRFGDVCQINHHLAIADFWGPLLGLASLSVVLQFITLGYCLQVFVKSIFNDNEPYRTGTSDLPSIQSSFEGRSGLKAYRRVKKLIALQWRSAAIVLVILGEIIFFSIVFLKMDGASQLTPAMQEKATDWAICLITTTGDKNKCYSKATKFVLPESIVLAVLICLAMSGFWCLLFLGRWSMVLGWKNLLKRKMLRQKTPDLDTKNTYLSSPHTQLYTLGKLEPVYIAHPFEKLSSNVGPSTSDSSPTSTPNLEQKQFANDYYYKRPPIGNEVRSAPAQQRQTFI